MNPLADDAATDPQDSELVTSAQAGSREALELLVTRHQAWIYNVARRMVYNPSDAEDATQEILIKVITKLSAFEGRSSFRTWLYRIVVNHLLNMKRGRSEAGNWDFARYAQALDATPDADLPDQASMPVDTMVLVEEAKIACTSGLLLCLDREQRLILILGEILGVSDRVGSELLDVTRENFRQKLARARRDLHSFLQNKCGLVNHGNPCRCAKKTQGFMKAGYVNPERLLFAKERITRVNEVAGKACDALSTLDDAYGDIYRSHPFHDSPDFVAHLRSLFDQPDFKSLWS